MLCSPLLRLVLFFFNAPATTGLYTLSLHDALPVAVVDEHHAVADEDAVLDRHAPAHEAVARDLAVAADHRAALHLDERADARVIADAAPVQVDQRRLWNRNVCTELDVRRNHFRAPPAPTTSTGRRRGRDATGAPASASADAAAERASWRQ